MGTPLGGAPYEIWAPAERRITEVRKYKWHTAVGLGPNARGGATNFMKDVTGTQPSIAQASVARP